MKHRNKATLARMINPDGGTPPALRARMLSCLDRGAGGFLHSSGGNALLQMHNIAFRDACLFRACLSVVGMAPPPAAGGLVASYNAQIRECSACHRPMGADGCHAMARVGCEHAMTAGQWHAPVMNAFRGVITGQGNPSAKLVGKGLEGGPLSDIWELKNPLPAGIAVDANGLPTTGQRGDMRVQLGGSEGGQTVVCDLTVTAAVPIAVQPRRAADGGLEPPTIPPRLLLRPGNAAADGERGKFKLYGDRWVVPRGALAPLSYEVHGAASSSTHAFVERVAQTMYPGGEGGEGDFGGRRAAFISMLRQRTSVALQTANARAIARWRRLSWNTSALVGAGVAAG